MTHQKLYKIFKYVKLNKKIYYLKSYVPKKNIKNKQKKNNKGIKKFIDVYDTL